MKIKPGYHALAAVLQMALDQAQEGKGALRHANGQPFLSQPIMEIGRMVGNGYQLGQAMKKAQESTRLPWPAAQRELLGAINYLAAAYLDIGERNGDPTAEEFQAGAGMLDVFGPMKSPRRGEKEVYAFAEAIIDTLNLPKNAAKGGWDSMNFGELMDRLQEEEAELNDALFNDEGRNLDPKSEATDVGAFAMMIFNKLVDSGQTTV